MPTPEQLKRIGLDLGWGEKYALEHGTKAFGVCSPYCAPEPVDGELVQRMIAAADICGTPSNARRCMSAALTIARPVIEQEQRQKDVEEMLAGPTPEEHNLFQAAYAESQERTSEEDRQVALKAVFDNRRARYAPKPKTDPAVEAVRAIQINWLNMHLTHGSAEEVVAAVRKADKGGRP